MVAEVGFEPFFIYDLQIMSLTSYQLLHSAILVDEKGLEPSKTS
jgi:hypothetical protein